VRAGRVERVAAGKAFFILCLLVQRVFADVTSTVKIRTRFWIFRMVFLPGRPRKSPTDIHGMFAETRTPIPSVTQAGGQSTRLFFSHLICQQPFFFSRGLSDQDAWTKMHAHAHIWASFRLLNFFVLETVSRSEYLIHGSP